MRFAIFGNLAASRFVEVAGSLRFAPVAGQPYYIGSTYLEF